MSAPQRYTHSDFSKSYQPQVYAVNPRTIQRYPGVRGYHKLRAGLDIETAQPAPDAEKENEFWQWVRE